MRPRRSESSAATCPTKGRSRCFMSMYELEEALALIAMDSDADFEGSKPESLVDRAETVLDLKLPPTYRRFLLELGCGDVNGFEVYGITHESFEESGIPDAVWITLRERADSGLSDKYVLISERGDGSYYALDLGQQLDSGEAPVIIWMPGAEAGGASESASEDFGKFLLQQIKVNRT